MVLIVVTFFFYEHFVKNAWNLLIKLLKESKKDLKELTIVKSWKIGLLVF